MTLLWVIIGYYGLLWVIMGYYTSLYIKKLILKMPENLTLII